VSSVLFAYDGSDPARRALEYASRLAPDDDVAVISVAPALIEAPHTAEYTDPRHDPAQAKRDLEEAQGVLETRGAKVEAILATGNPAAEIIKAAEERAARLIVVGSRGQHAFERFLVGSIAERLVRHAPCDVLIVR
jgi:nucleotide-binding universal stress UspA family protein